MAGESLAGDRDGRELLQNALSMPTITSDTLHQHLRVRERQRLKWWTNCMYMLLLSALKLSFFKGCGLHGCGRRRGSAYALCWLLPVIHALEWKHSRPVRH